MARADDDFLSQLQQRMALSEGAAVSMLGSWLASYEPGPRALAQQVELRAARSPKRTESRRAIEQRSSSAPAQRARAGVR